MYAQVEKQKENESRAVANEVSQKQSGGEPTLQFVNNRPEAIAQRKLQKMENNRQQAYGVEIFQKKAGNHSQAKQLYARKIVAESARAHYDDGWGDKYDITDDDTLKADVPDEVTGSGGINLGWYDAPENEQVEGDRLFEKYCTIEYADGNRDDETKIYHCGPSGRRHYHD